jgi:hypothetical protein
MKTVAEKLQIKPDTTVWVSDPASLALLGPLPAGVAVAKTIGVADAAVLFAPDEAGLRKVLEKHAADLAIPKVFWVAYPKGNRTDVNRDSLWPILGEYGLRPNSQVALDDVWSALRFRPPKPGEAPFLG